METVGYKWLATLTVALALLLCGLIGYIIVNKSQQGSGVAEQIQDTGVTVADVSDDGVKLVFDNEDGTTGTIEVSDNGVVVDAGSIEALQKMSESDISDTMAALQVDPQETSDYECWASITGRLYADDGVSKCELGTPGSMSITIDDQKSCDVYISGSTDFEGDTDCKHDPSSGILSGTDGLVNCIIDSTSDTLVFNSPRMSCELDGKTGKVNRKIKK
jgi:hypothetical protein